MNTTHRRLAARKRIALVAHDHRKSQLLAWVADRKERLQRHDLLGTGTTGHFIRKSNGLEVECLMSGPPAAGDGPEHSSGP